jgi:hypothetical protein
VARHRPVVGLVGTLADLECLCVAGPITAASPGSDGSSLASPGAREQVLPGRVDGAFRTAGHARTWRWRRRPGWRRVLGLGDTAATVTLLAHVRPHMVGRTAEGPGPLVWVGLWRCYYVGGGGNRRLPLTPTRSTASVA